MHRVFYNPGLGGDPVALDGPDAFIRWGDGLRSHEWTRSLSARFVRGLTLGVREVKVVAVAYDDAANTLREVADADVAARTPGTLSVDDTWNIRCYIVESETAEVYYEAVKLNMTVALVDTAWWRDKSQHFVIGLAADGLDHSYDHDYDLSHSVGASQVKVETRLGAKPKITFYGPCTNPYITIGGNRYEVDVQILSDRKVVIDAQGSTPTVQLIDQYGNAQSVFAYAVRDGGLGGGSYAFEPLPYGTLQVGWSGAFSFDVEWREIDTEPPWDR